MMMSLQAVASFLPFYWTWESWTLVGCQLWFVPSQQTWAFGLLSRYFRRIWKFSLFNFASVVDVLYYGNTSDVNEATSYKATWSKAKALGGKAKSARPRTWASRPNPKIVALRPRLRSNNASSSSILWNRMILPISAGHCMSFLDVWTTTPIQVVYCLLQKMYHWRKSHILQQGLGFYLKAKALGGKAKPQTARPRLWASKPRPKICS